MKRHLSVLLVSGLLGGALLHGAAPVVDYVRISQRTTGAPPQLTKLVDIDYKVTDADGDLMTITVTGYNGDGGAIVPLSTLSGDGAGGATVASGEHRLTWNAGVDWGEAVGSGLGGGN
jgi:hypothetical protein